MKKRRFANLKRNTYKFENTKNVSNLRIVSMIPGDRKVAGCFNFFNSNILKCGIIDNNRMFPIDPTGSLDDFFLRGYLNYWRFF